MNKHALVATLLATSLLAGCGGDDSGSKSSGDRSPQEVLSDTENALSKVKSFHLEGTGVDREDGEQKISGDFAIPGRVRVALEREQGKMELLVVDKQVFFKADRAFWEAQGDVPPQVLDAVVDKWVKMPAGADVPTGEFEAFTNSETIGHCLVGKGLGTVVSAGTDTVDGKKVVVLEDKGDKPGSSPGKLYVAAEGESLPLRAMQTGPEKPGGQPDARCGETENDASDTIKSDLKFSRYNDPVDISAPADAVDLEQLAQQAQS